MANCAVLHNQINARSASSLHSPFPRGHRMLKFEGRQAKISEAVVLIFGLQRESKDAARMLHASLSLRRLIYMQAICFCCTGSKRSLRLRASRMSQAFFLIHFCDRVHMISDVICFECSFQSYCIKEMHNKSNRVLL